MAFNEEEQALLTTILYSDIFQFPLTKDELWRYLISPKQISFAAFEHALHRLSSPQKRIKNHELPARNASHSDAGGRSMERVLSILHGYYCLKGKESSITKRIRNLSEVKKKMKLAHRAAYLLSFIPTVRFIGISGGLATGCATADDDIDFLIITEKNTLFVTRLLVASLLEWKRLRRRRRAKHAANTICVNLFLDEMHLHFTKDKHDVYIAREIVQVKPLFERKKTYQHFLEQNDWITQFLPNANSDRPLVIGKHWRTDYHSIQALLFIGKPFERFVRFIQRFYMQKHQTIETVSNTVLAFHPKDYRLKTLQILGSKQKKLGLLTEK